MNKFTLLCGLLALKTMELHSNIWGKKPEARLNEDQLQSIEDALVANDTTALNSTIETHVATIAGLNTEAENATTAIADAFALNGLTLPEGKTTVEAITALGLQCKEFGEATNTHSIQQTDGLDKNPEGKDPSANYAHNKVFNEDKFKTIK